MSERCSKYFDDRVVVSDPGDEQDDIVEQTKIMAPMGRLLISERKVIAEYHIYEPQEA